MGKKALVADDDPATRGVAVACLKNAGFTALEAADGVRAIEMAEADPPDVILLDLLMPRRDGYAALLALRSRPSTRHTPVIILSGEDDASQAGVAKILGAQGFFSKPLRPDALIGLVHKLFPDGGGA